MRSFVRRVATTLVVCAAIAACTTIEEQPAPAPAKEPPPPAPAKPAVVAPPPRPKPAPEPVPEPAKEPVRSLGVDELAKGVKSYDDGDYRAAAKQFQAALDLGLAVPSERALAHKHLAFMACVAKRIANCRGEFRKAFADDPAFDLTPAEAGHPTWGPVFRSVKAEVAKAAKAKQKPKAR